MTQHLYAQQTQSTMLLHADTPLRSNPRLHPGVYVRFGKRLLDVVVVILLSAVAVPLLLCVSLAVRVSLGSGVVFRQRRVGRHGRDFVMYKFRTMRNCRRHESQPFEGPDRRKTHKHDADPRHTKLGKLLRKTSLDELPQLLNVLRGDMSLVGPRPELSDVVDRYGLRSHPRHTVLPGITGHWQTTSRNDGLLLHECFDHDLAYLESISLFEDLRILGRTGSVLLAAGGR